jgi:hypothetical protein
VVYTSVVGHTQQTNKYSTTCTHKTEIRIRFSYWKPHEAESDSHYYCKTNDSPNIPSVRKYLRWTRSAMKPL